AQTGELRDRAGGARPRRVEHDELGAGESLLAEEVERRGRLEARPGEPACRGAGPGVGNRGRARLDADHVGAGARERQTEVAGAAEEIEDAPRRGGHRDRKSTR